MMSLAPHTVAFGRAATASVELFKLIDRESEINAFDDSGVKPEQITGTITMEDVSFCYPTRPEVTVLDKFCLTVPAHFGRNLLFRLLELCHPGYTSEIKKNSLLNKHRFASGFQRGKP